MNIKYIILILVFVILLLILTKNLFMKDKFTQNVITPECTECIKYCNTLKNNINDWKKCILDTINTPSCKCTT